MSLADLFLKTNSPIANRTVDLTPAQLFDVLGSQRRRTLIRALDKDFDGEAPVPDLAEYVAAVENRHDDPDAVSREERKRVYVSLHQTHVPALVEMGVVRYRDDDGAVVSTAMVAELRRFLAAADQFAVGDGGGE